jgi:hypothetical protein
MRVFTIFTVCGTVAAFALAADGALAAQINTNSNAPNVKVHSPAVGNMNKGIQQGAPSGPSKRPAGDHKP